MYGELLVCPNEVDFRKYYTNRKVKGVIFYEQNGVPVRNGASVQIKVVSTRSPPAVLGH